MVLWQDVFTRVVMDYRYLRVCYSILVVSIGGGILNYKVEKHFEHNGLPCLVLGLDIGYRCGYVGLPKGHKYYEVPYRDIPVDVHGGLTFGMRDDTYPIINKSEYYFVGFDCSHWTDALDMDLVRELTSKSRVQDKLCCLEHFIEGEPWTTDAVTNEVIRLADQLNEGLTNQQVQCIMN